MRKCRNWQTSKTKDLVAFGLCGFKSHLPHQITVSLEKSRFAVIFLFLGLSVLALRLKIVLCVRFHKEKTHKYDKKKGYNG